MYIFLKIKLDFYLLALTSCLSLYPLSLYEYVGLRTFISSFGRLLGGTASVQIDAVGVSPPHPDFHLLVGVRFPFHIERHIPHCFAGEVSRASRAVAPLISVRSALERDHVSDIFGECGA